MTTINRLVTVVGTRPNFIKAAPVCQAVAQVGIEEILVHTGQHYDAALSDQLFEELQIPTPKHHLAVGSGSFEKQVGDGIQAMAPVLRQERPDRRADRCGVVGGGPVGSVAAPWPCRPGPLDGGGGPLASTL